MWYPPTDDFFFVQNAGAKAAGTGLAKSAIVQKINLKQADAVKDERNATGKVQVDVVETNVINPNGGTNWRGQIVFCGEGQGVGIPSSLFLMNPVPPYNSTVLLNNYFGRQFNSLNDIAVHPSNGWLYFTDVDYGVLQDFRGKNQIRRQVYRFNPDTGVVRAVTDYMLRPNGLTFSPDGKWLYVTDTGAAHGFAGMDWEDPASIYRFGVRSNGQLGPGELFTYVHVGVPDGVRCDSEGNVYSGVGDGVHVWNSDGTLLGKIYVGETSANLQVSRQRVGRESGDEIRKWPGDKNLPAITRGLRSLSPLGDSRCGFYSPWRRRRRRREKQQLQLTPVRRQGPSGYLRRDTPVLCHAGRRGHGHCGAVSAGIAEESIRNASVMNEVII